MDRKQLQVLLIEDNPDDIRLTRKALDAGDDPFYRVDEVLTLKEASLHLEKTPYDAVLLDVGLLGSVGVEAVAKLRSIRPFLPPLIVLTSHDDQRVALEALDRGAQEYVIKSDIVCLSRAIRHAIMRQQMMAELNSANEMLNQKNVRLAELCDTAQKFVDNVSHEFRTPLTVIREFTSIVRDGCDGPVTAKQIEHLDKVLRRTDDLAIMVDDMLDISKLESGRLGVWRRLHRVPELIDTVIGSLTKRAESKNITLTSRLAPDLPETFCDDEKAQRVLVNLTVNAIKFTPDGGRIDIWARPTADRKEVTIGVTDSGPGISPENLKVVFDRFKQLGTNLRSSTRGFGLGLNIAKELVNLNLGEMKVESEIGHGSTFSFTLPCNELAIVFDRYAQRVIGLSETLSELSFVKVVIDAESSARAGSVVDEFLQRSIRSHDLAVQTSEFKWLIALLCPEADVFSAISRLKKEWKDFAQNCPGRTLPAIQMTRCGTWPLSAGSKRLDEEFRALVKEHVIEPPANGTVLVVDDDHEVGVCLGVRLRLAGYKVLSALNGEQGLASIIEHRPDAVVLDLRMPKKDGITMLREVRADERVGHTPIIVLSANIREQQRALEAGANFFIAKPYEASAVLSAIEFALNAKRINSAD